MAIDKPNLDSARKVRGVNLIDSDDEEFKETIKNAREKSEIPMEAAVLCKLKTMKRPIKLRENRQRTPGIQQHPEKKACMHRRHS